MEELFFLLPKDYFFDLQFFASPDDEGRTEDPTERKKKKAREEGNVAKSQELVSALVFLFTFWAVWMMVGTIYVTLKNFMVMSFESLNQRVLFDNVASYVLGFSMDFWKIMGPAVAVAVFIAILGNVAQVGFMFTLKPISPKFNKVLFTFKKLKEKMFSKTSFFNFITSLLKMLFLGLIFFIIIQGHTSEMVNLAGMGLTQSLAFLGSMMIKMFNAAGLFLLAIAVPDYIFKKKQYKDSLKMKKEEVKQEMKEDEGDPQIKGQIREMYNAMMNQHNIRRSVPQADVVVVNPTHFAVALKYDMEKMQAPMVIAKGEDDQALLIKQIAFENDVPVEENPPLARQIYAMTEVGDYIPEDFFLVIAELLIKVGKYGQNAKVAV